MGVMDSHNSDRVVVKDRRDVFRRELVRCIADKKACLPDGTIAYYNAPMGARMSARAQRSPEMPLWHGRRDMTHLMVGLIIGI